MSVNRKDIELILRYFKDKGSPNDTTTIGKAIKGRPRILQTSCERFIKENFTVAELVSRALSLRETKDA